MFSNRSEFGIDFGARHPFGQPNLSASTAPPAVRGGGVNESAAISERAVGDDGGCGTVDARLCTPQALLQTIWTHGVFPQKFASLRVDSELLARLQFQTCVHGPRATEPEAHQDNVLSAVDRQTSVSM